MTRTLILTFYLMTVAQQLFSSNISGKITDETGEGIPGVNIYVKGTYDGATSNTSGLFNFDTTEEGEQVLVASFVGYHTTELDINLNQDVTIDINLKPEISKLNGVVITAGSFEASDENKAVVFKPLDIATTAGALADIAGAMNTLPGTSTNGETGRLFVRGGTANETKAFINGMMVGNFYSASPNNVPTRSRFSPFLFKGTFFSAGGYSAEYGQALSSVLSLNSIDAPTESKTDFSIMSVGGGISHSKQTKKGGINAQFAYTNLDPYNGLVEQEFEWENGYTSENATMMYWHNFNKTDQVRVYANYDHSAFIIHMPNINDLENLNRIDLSNKNTYVNTSYKKSLNENSMLFTGISFGSNMENILFNNDLIENRENAIHLKSYWNGELKSNLNFKAGAEVISNHNAMDVFEASGSIYLPEFNNTIAAGFTEMDVYATKDLTFRAGLRLSNYSFLNTSKLSPRLSMAYRTGEYSQLSLAYGKFHQLPENDILLRSDQINFEEADHYLSNFQYIKDRRIFRIEAYYKNYRNLVKFDPNEPFNPTTYNNAGSGQAKGFDILWKDDKSIRSGQYWISYSYIDTRRDYRDYPGVSNFDLAARHNLSIVGKYFVQKWKTQFGSTISFNSGRPYNDPNLEGFNQQKTPHFADLSLNFSYLPKQNVVIHGSFTNILGRDNIFGYEFESEAGSDGHFASRPIRQAATRFLFLGVFVTLAKDKTQNQLENL